MPNAGAVLRVLTFLLGDVAYATDVLSVCEIRRWAPLTHLPRARPHVLGVMNLRGTIVPVIDLRVCFRLATAQFTERTVVIIVSGRTARGQRQCGLVVDAVCEVLDIHSDAVLPAPEVSSADMALYVRGITTLDNRLTVLLDTDELLTRELSPPDVAVP